METLSDFAWMNTAIIAFATFFATISPISVAVAFAALTSGDSPWKRRSQATKGVVIAAGIMLLFAVTGDKLLIYMGISLPALRTAGGILLFLIAIDMVFGKNSGGVTTTDDENTEAEGKTDISVFPLATPLIAGPGAIGAVILLMADSAGDAVRQFAVLGGLMADLVILFVLLLMATQVQRLLGVTGMTVITRVMGVLLAALAAQFVLDGIAQSGILG